jgi:sugar-phosphatase
MRKHALVGRAFTVLLLSRLPEERRKQVPPTLLTMVLQVQGVLFDIDGTLVDSGAAVERSWHSWAQEYHLDTDAVIRACHGRRTEDIVPQFVSPQQRATAIARELALELADLDGVVALPGSHEVLNALPH